MSIGKMLLASLASLCLVGYVNASTTVEIVAKIESSRPGNITVSNKGRIFLSMQPLDAPKLRVVELLADGSTIPFPNLDWADGPEKGEVGFSSVIGIDSTDDDKLWILDMGSQTAPAQIVGWDLMNDRLYKQITIDKAALVDNSFLQDFVIDTKRNKIYIADTTLGNLVGEPNPAFVVVDLNTKKAWRFLQGHKTLLAPKHEVKIDGHVLAAKRSDGSVEPLYLGLNPITIDNKNNWVYFGTVNGSDIFRIPAKTLANQKSTTSQLAKSIQKFAKKRPSDGMIMANDGKIYVGDVEHNAIGVASHKDYKLFVRDDELFSWADGFAIQGDDLYITQNSLHLNPALNKGEEGSTKPYHILRIKLDDHAH